MSHFLIVTFKKTFLSALYVIAVLAVPILFGMATVTTADVTTLQTDEAPVFIFEKPELQEEIAEVRRTLNGQLTEYRQAEQRFSVARNQYNQLNTLSSLEAAIQATKDVMSVRASVLQTYLTLLRLELLNTSGLRLEYREYAMTENEQLSAALLRHLDQVQTSLERAAIAQVADDFELLASRMQRHIMYTRSVLKLARYQAIVDSTDSLLDTIVEQSQDPEDPRAIIVTPQDERAFRQVKTKLDEVKLLLSEVDGQVQLAMNPEARTRERELSIDPAIARMYAELRQVYRFLDELIKNF